jgi:hypothetical protein
MAQYRYIPYNQNIIDIHKRDAQLNKDALIRNALVLLHQQHKRLTSTSLWVRTYLEEHNKKIKTKPIDKIMNVINLWLFLK